jgi:MinD superfamily P-loop ATPase
LKLPFAVVINRSDLGDDNVQRYCDEENIEVILKIPDDRRIAETYSTGNMIVDVLPEYRNNFLRLYESITQKMQV